MTPAEFRDAMQVLAVAYRRELTRPTMRLYWAEFGYLAPEALAAALTAHVRTAKFFPTIAELRAALGMDRRPGLAEAGVTFEALLGDGPAYDARLGDYWTLQAVSDRFGPVALAAFMAAGGTRAFRDRTTRNVDFLRRDFLAGWTEAAASLALNPAHAAFSPAPQRQGMGAVSDSLQRLLPASGKDAAAGEAEHGDAWLPEEEAP